MDDLEVFELPKDSFPKEVGKAFAISAASSAGLFGGMLVVGTIVRWTEKRRDRKNAKKTTEEE